MNRRDSIVALFCAFALSLFNGLKLTFGGEPSKYPPGIPGPAGHLGVEGPSSIPLDPFRTKPGDPGHGRHGEARDLARALIALPRNNKHDILLQLSKTDPDILKLVTHYLQEYRVSLMVGVGAILARVRLRDLFMLANGDNSPRTDCTIWDFYEAEQQLLIETSCLETNQDEPEVYLLAYKAYCAAKGIPDTVRLQNVKEWEASMLEEPLAVAREEELNFRTDEGISIL